MGDRKLEHEELLTKLEEMQKQVNELTRSHTTDRLAIFKNLYSTRNISIIILGLLVIPIIVYASQITKPNTFTTGTTVSASEINDNFDTIYTRVNGVGATYRFGVFGTSDDVDYSMEGNPDMFGGVSIDSWISTSALASDISSSKEKQRTLFTQKGYAKKNAMIYADSFLQGSQGGGKVVTALFRIKNSTAGAIDWTPNFYYTAWDAYGELASVALNGANSWSGTVTGKKTNLTLSIPASRTSSVIFVSTSGQPHGVGGTSIQIRLVTLGFYGDSLDLPAGLEFIDDLDTASGNWSN